ncbi:CPBP family glutamic-type intramembrane protease [Mucilaginibacter sp.]
MNNIAEVENLELYKSCIQCDELVATESRFCNHCGHGQNNYSNDVSEKKWSNIKQIALFFILDTVICCVGSFITYFKTLDWSIVIDGLLAIVALTFFFNNWSKNKSILVWRNFSITKLIAYCGIAVVGSFFVNITVGWLNHSLFSKEYSYYALYATSKYGKELMLFFVAVMPALFEELGYRGFVLEKLLQIVDRKQAIFITAFLFAIMHMSFISLFWLIPFALLLAYVRIKENTLWYGVLIHFCFNFTACTIELLNLNHHYTVASFF